MKKEDLKPEEFPCLSWDQKNWAKSLDELAAYVANYTQGAIDWYLSRKRRKKIWGRSLRGLAIAFGGLGALVPLVSNLAEKSTPLGELFRRLGFVKGTCRANFRWCWAPRPPALSSGIGSGGSPVRGFATCARA